MLPNFVRSSLALLFSVYALAAKQCFAPDGSIISDQIYQPCIQIDGVESMCCNLNSTTPDTCLPNGLCLTSPASIYPSTHWRVFCTDQNWNSPNCLNNTICDAAHAGNSNWTARVSKCTDGTYCCGPDQKCCSTNTFALQPTLVAIGNTSDNKTHMPESTSTKVAIGVGIGIPMGVLSVATLVLGYCWGKKKAEARYQSIQHDAHALPHIDTTKPTPVYEVSAVPRRPAELSS
ncbi:hypothetical protein ABOM_004616 [Aspergillus bombycis]|uniref:Mid2 domain-containing protein n=1 Tax=Aspergillus bombycis TaxID=109264 RepID=A0A1F8A5H7_9EURO|nr:hypothetical protein ABOM_004616 [Aspergillus bombycis]OGM46558.1 hypothetical protein ABOM_004616 [Aspergillus bombycis]